MLKNQHIIAYPTESMFGLGCDPNSEQAVKKLLQLKNRNIEKGFILVAAHFCQIKKYINEEKISNEQKKTMQLVWPGHFTFLVPAKLQVPYWLTGKFNTIAVRISSHAEIIKLCNAFGGALISTSANISSMPPCITDQEVLKYFGKNFPLLHGTIGTEKNPSKIVNLIDGNIIRHV
ncbi:Sua5/YciO/YrdC/YwlC family protein [Buchnera aphidicola]|nr:Sua5/YciO/YrdC/YwlC family protein [Buchnera aphidicola]